MKLIPLQLRIADFVAIDLAIVEGKNKFAEIAYIKGDEIVAEEWDAKTFVKMGVTLED